MAFNHRFFSFIIVALACLQGIQKTRAEQPKDLNKAGLAQIAFSVGQSAVTWQDVKERYFFVLKSSNMEDTRKVRSVLFPQVVQQLCNENLQLAMAKKVGLSMSQNEKQAALDNFAKMNKTTLIALKENFKKNDLSIRTLEQRLTAQNLWIQYIRGAESSVVKITPAKVEQRRKIYEKAQKTNQFEISEIVVQNLDVAQEVYEKAKVNNTSFSILAQEFSTSISAKSGGKIGWMTIPQMEPNAQKALAILTSANKDTYKVVGHITAPIKTMRGYSIYKISDVKSPGKPAYSKTEITMVKRLINMPVFTSDEGVKAFEFSMNNLMEIKGEKEFKNHECTYAEKATIQKSTLASLSEQMRHMIESMPIGTISKPIPLAENLMVVFMVTGKKIHPENPLTDNDFKMQIRQEMLERFATSHLRQFRKIIPISDATGMIQGATPLIKTVSAKKVS